MGHGGPNRCSPLGNSLLLLNLPIVSYKILTREESHSKDHKTGSHGEEEEVTKNKGEVFSLFLQKGSIDFSQK